MLLYKSYKNICCCLSPDDKNKLHDQLQQDLNYHKKYNACRNKIEEYYDNKMDKLRLQAAYKKHLLDLEHERRLNIINLEVNLLSDFLYEDNKIIKHINIEDTKDKIVLWDPISYDKSNDKYVSSTYNIVNIYIICHILIIAALFLQV